MQFRYNKEYFKIWGGVEGGDPWVQVLHQQPAFHMQPFPQHPTPCHGGGAGGANSQPGCQPGNAYHTLRMTAAIPASPVPLLRVADSPFQKPSPFSDHEN